MEKTPTNSGPNPDAYIQFALDTQQRFTKYRYFGVLLSKLNGKEDQQHDEAMIQQMTEAVEIIGRGLMHVPIVTSFETPDGNVDAMVFGVGVDTDSGIILRVQRSPQHTPEEISLSSVSQLRPAEQRHPFA